MRQTKRYLAFLLALALLALAGCRSQTVGPEQPSDSPAPSASESPSPDESDSPAPTDSQPPEASPSAPAESESQPVKTDEGVPADEDAVLTVDDQELAAVRHYSPLGYSIVYPADQITVKSWEDGDNYQVDAARGTYLAVSQISASSISAATAIVQFENAVEDEPKGFIFGSDGYAGVRMVQQQGGLSLEFILVEKDGTIFLLERAVFTGGEEYENVLQAMLDSFTIE